LAAAAIAIVGLGLVVLVVSALGDDDPGTASAASSTTTLTTTSPTVATSSTIVSTTSLSPSSTTHPATTSPTTTTAPTTTVPTTPPGNRAPTIVITAPPNLSMHKASFDPATGRFGATITFSANAADPDGDPVTVRWYSSIEGYLGTGAVLSATIHTVGSDSTQPYVSARATDQWGASTTDVIQIIVWIPSET
jgi:hypothetical protein